MKRKTDEKKCRHCVVETKPWYRQRLFLVFSATVIILAAAHLFPGLSPVMDVFFMYVGMIWWAVLLGLVTGGVIGHYVPDIYVSSVLARRRKRTVIYSVVFGFLMSACSHGILAIAMELYRKGASVPSVIAFLLASPWANLPITILLFGFFGFNALYMIVFAIVIAIITGFAYQGLEARGWIEKPIYKGKVAEGFSVRKDARKRLKAYRFRMADVRGVWQETWNLTKMVLWWILIGMVAGAFIGAFVTPELFQAYLGPTLFGLFVTLVVATIIEVCSEGSAPIAFEIFRQTGAFGNAWTFLLAGVATDYTEIGLIASNIGRRAAFWLPVITVPQVLILGYLFNIFL